MAYKTNAEMEAVIDAGGSVSYNGTVITTKAGLPSDNDIAALVAAKASAQKASESGGVGEYVQLEELDLTGNAAHVVRANGTTSVVTKTEVGLGNATDTSDANKPVSTAQAVADAAAQAAAIAAAAADATSKSNAAQAAAEVTAAADATAKANAIGVTAAADVDAEAAKRVSNGIADSTFLSNAAAPVNILGGNSSPRRVIIIVDITETFAANTGTATIFDIGETGTPEKFVANLTTGNAGTQIIKAGILQGDAALVVTPTAAVGDGAGAIEVNVLALPVA